MGKKVLNQTLVYWIAALVILFDQYTKYLVRQTIPLNGSWSPFEWLEPWLRLRHINNTGAAFGMFQNGGLIFAILAVIVSLVIIYYSFNLPEGQWGMRVVLGLQLGGALGNLIDRVLFGTVTDFVSVGTFAIFNVADASISIGVALLVGMMILEARAQPSKPAAPPSTSDAETADA